ncbi:MAG: ABC transporter permease [Deltaproteobacteria bacterium]|nr:ABC transporter permease [Deltaproteobacteria bacterium]
MSWFAHFLTALDSIRSNVWRSFLTTLGVVIGVTSVVLLVSLGEGARSYFADLFAEMGTNLLLVFPGKEDTKGVARPMFTTVHKLTVDDARAIFRRGTAVAQVNAALMGAGTVKYLNRSRNTKVVGTDEALPDVHLMKVALGGFVAPEDVDAKRRVAVLGQVVQQELFGDENPVGKTIKITGTKFRVIGVMASKGQSLGIDLDDLVFIPVTAATELFNQESLTRISVKALSNTQVEAAMEEVRQILIRRHNNNEDFTIVSQADMLSTFDKVARTMELVILGIASISLVVGGIGIMNIMLVSVRERTREIGLRMAVGARRKDVERQFLVESVTVSLVGGVVGLALGLAVIALFNAFGPGLTVRFTPWVIVVAFGFSFVVGVASGFYPAKKASLLDPIEALRYE